jgi:hypothetical protein
MLKIIINQCSIIVNTEINLTRAFIPTVIESHRIFIRETGVSLMNAEGKIIYKYKHDTPRKKGDKIKRVEQDKNSPSVVRSILVNNIATQEGCSIRMILRKSPYKKL